ncbi:MAG: PKD domain-containing protein [bacterium]|nr:PKD domain-containing protein [bacterium]
MAEEEKPKNKAPNTTDIQDYEMGEEQAIPAEPKINKYNTVPQPPTGKPASSASVDPKAPAPAAAPASPQPAAPTVASTGPEEPLKKGGEPVVIPGQTIAKPGQAATPVAPGQPPVAPAQPVTPGQPPASSAQPAAQTGQPAAPAQPTTPTQPTTPGQPAKPGQPLRPGQVLAKPGGPSTVAKKKIMLGCLGAFGGILLLFLILSFVFLAQSGDEPSPMAKLLGVNQGAFVNGLITFIHFIFIIISLTAFVFTMVGLFKASMAKKGDKETKKAGLKKSLVGGLILITVLIIWGIVFAYLDSKRVATGPEITAPIITDPEETLELSAPVEVKFDGSNITFNQNKYKIVAHEWNFGDDSTDGTGQVVSHVYEEKGTFTVSLTVKVEEKATGEVLELGTFTKIVSITDEALAAVFEATPQSGEAPLEVEFDAGNSKDPDGNIESYEWDLDEDGSYDDEEGEKITHTFEKIGKYTVGLRVTNTLGEFNIAEKDIDVKKSEDPEPVITIDDEPGSYVVAVSYVFKGEESTSPNGKITKYEWNFNDGSKPVNTKTASHVFESEGTFEVTLTVTDEEDKVGVVSKEIVVGAPKGSPRAKIFSIPTLKEDDLFLKGTQPFALVLDAKQTTDSDNNIVDYSWDFGDDSQNGVGESVGHTFVNEGTYTIKLSVTDADDNVGVATLVVKVEAQGIKAELQADKVEGNIPLTVNFDASGSAFTNGQITSYQWDFGDGSDPKLGSANISHKYTGIGTYNASVKVIGSDNSADTAKISITVREIPLSACFTSVFEKGSAPLETTFDPGCSTGTISSYLWDFDDGSNATSAKPNHTFEEPGEYEVTLEIADSENTVSKAIVNITVTE